MAKKTRGTLILLLLMVPALANAGTIDIGNTGFDTYLVSGPGISEPFAAVVASPKAGPWVSTSGASWISPSLNQSWPMVPDPSGSLPGTYQYKITFDLTGYNPETAIIEGEWSTDNSGKILLNGNYTIHALDSNSFGSLHKFALNSGFVSGVNTLTFEIVNDFYGTGSGTNPTGVIVKYTKTYVPEPSFVLLLGLGLGIGTLATWRVRK